MTNSKEINFTQELLRKGIHLLSLSIPIFFAVYGQKATLWAIIPMTLISLFIDVFSRKNRFLNPIMMKYFGGMLREHELSKFITSNGASWMLLSACFVFVIFPKHIAIAAFSILIISDLSAALIGRKFGRIKILMKTLEGSLTFFATAAGIVYIVYNYYSLDEAFLYNGIWASLAAAIVEGLAKELGLDDNIAIPMTFGWLMLLLGS